MKRMRKLASLTLMAALTLPATAYAQALPDAPSVLDLLRRLPKYKPGPAAGSAFTRAPGTSALIGTVVPEILDREIIVTFPADLSNADVFAILRAQNLSGETLYVSTLLNQRVVRIRIPDDRPIDAVLQAISADVRIIIAQPHYVYIANGAAKALPVPQYAPDKLKLTEAHKIAQGKRVKIAVIDTQVDTTHPAFGGSITETFDALGETKPVAENHGTAIAAIVGARAELTGVAPGANILAIRAFAGNAKGQPQSYTLAILKALDFAVVSGARVINMSFAGPNDPILGQAIAAANAKGVVVVAAAGNGGPDAKPAFPAAYPTVIAVTATDNADQLYKNANHGTYIAVAAPGVDIIAAATKGAYDISSGTSMAAAHVSGIAALMLEKNPKLTPKDIRAMLLGSVRKQDGKPADEFGAGIADAAGALAAVK